VLIDLADGRVSPPAAAELNALWQTVIGIPLLHRDQSLGVMCLLTRQVRTASSFDMALYASMGHQIAAAISNAQLFQTTLDERSRLKALIESSRDGIILNVVDGMILVMNCWP
jgi:GAF domain-containing protein